MRRCLDDHFSGRANNVALIWSLLSFESLVPGLWLVRRRHERFTSSPSCRKLQPLMSQPVRHVAVSAVECAAALALLILAPARLLRRLFEVGPVFSLWTGTPIVTLGRNAKAERLLGCDSRSLVTHTYYITQEFDYDLSRLRSIPLLGLLVPLGIFVWACVVADRLHFFCDRGILPPRRSFTFNAFELWAYSVLRIDVFVWTYGADFNPHGHVGSRTA